MPAILTASDGARICPKRGKGYRGTPDVALEEYSELLARKLIYADRTHDSGP